MTTISFRCDEATERLLDSLALGGESRSDTIRRALSDADRLRRREQMRREAEALAGDAADRAEVAEVATDLEHLRVW